MAEEFIEIEDIEKDKRKEEVQEKISNVKEKAKAIGSRVGKGAKAISSTVAAGASGLAKKGVSAYKEYNTPEAKQKSLDAEEARLERQVRVQTQRNKIKKLQEEARPARSSSPSPLGGFGGLDMGKVLGGGGGNQGGFSNGGGMNFGGNLDNVFGSLGETPRRTKKGKGKRKKVVNPLANFRL